MTDPNRLEADLVWGDDGHLAEVALTAIADGESGIVPAEAVRHAETCELCGERLADAAMLSASMSRVLDRAVADRRHAVQPARRPLPIAALAAGLALAALGALPSVLEVPAFVGDLGALLHALPALLRSALVLVRTAADSASDASVAVSFAATALMLFVGWVIARKMPRQLGGKGSAS